MSGEAGQRVSVPASGSKAQCGSEHPCIHAFLHFFFHAPHQEARIKMNYQVSTNKKVQHESQLSAKKDDKLFFNGKNTLAGPARAQPWWEDWRLQTEMSPSWDEQPGRRVRPLPRVGSGRSRLVGTGAPQPRLLPVGLRSTQSCCPAGRWPPQQGRAPPLVPCPRNSTAVTAPSPGRVGRSIICSPCMCLSWKRGVVIWL